MIFYDSFWILVNASWDGPVQTIEKEETIQEANEEAAAAQDDSQINQNRVDDESMFMELVWKIFSNFRTINWKTGPPFDAKYGQRFIH